MTGFVMETEFQAETLPELMSRAAAEAKRVWYSELEWRALELVRAEAWGAPPFDKPLGERTK